MRAMKNPYAGLPDHAFWKRAVAVPAPEAVDPVVSVPFRIGKADRVATAGSCFAQHISRTLTEQGFHYLVTEPAPAGGGDNYGVFPARFGNIYTVRQLLQLFDRAYGLFEPLDRAWRRPDGAWVDPFRPLVEPAGFASVARLEADRDAHLAAVRNMFEGCDVFIFTLGLTEGWVSSRDGAVFPLAPGVAAAPETEDGGHEFVNFGVAAMTADLLAFFAKLRTVNPAVRIVLTVSPVSLIATYEPRHVLVSTIYSKSALRVVAEEASHACADVAYFPSYEIITGHHHRYGFFEPDLRSVTPAGVAHVMSVFRRHFLGEGDGAGEGMGRPIGTRAAGPAPQAPPAAPAPVLARPDLAALNEVVCDEAMLDR
jgi:hypothetical protein